MLCLLILGSLISSGLAQGFYKVVGPRIIRPNSEYHASVGIQETSVPTTVNITIWGQSNTGNSFNTYTTVLVEPYTTKIANLEIGDIEPGEYKLTTRGYGGVQFQSTTPLNYFKKSYSVFIQTDKAVYKPGHKILFRTLILNSQLKPLLEARNEPIVVHITDGGGNKVKEWKDIIATKGVFSGELQLSNQPVLGKWNILVTIRKQTYMKFFEVAEYVLPKFLIDIQAPKHTTFEENILNINIQSKYNYGKKVKGVATVTIYPTIYSGVIQPIFQNPVRKVFPIDGSANVDFDIANELKLSNEYERTVIVDVIIEEALTGRRQNNSMEVHIHKYDYQMEIIKTAEYYKPGLKYTSYIKVLNHDGTPLKSDQNTVTVRHGYSRVNEVYKEEKYQFDKNGIIKLELYPPINSTNETALRIEAEYINLKERMSPVPAAISPTNTFLQVGLEKDSNPEVNHLVEVIVNCTEPLKYINYQILGRGDILIAHTSRINYQKEFKFHFTSTYAMVPTAHLLVNYIRNDGQVVADSLDIEIDGLVQNHIDVQLNTVESQPDEDVSLGIRSQPNSYIGLLAVDRNVGKLRSGYDLSYEAVAEELKSYDVADFSPYASIMKDANSHYFWKPGASSTHDIFHDSGAVIVTNALVPSYRPTLEDIYLRPVSYGSSTVKPDRGAGLALHSVTRPPLAGPFAFSRIPRPVWDKPKVYLTEDIADTWLFTNFSLSLEGKPLTIKRKVPNSLTTWVVSGFSLNSRYGLGLLESPKKLQISKNFFLKIELPYSIQREETLSIPAVVYNNLDKDILAEVTIHNPEQKFRFTDANNKKNSTTKIELYRRTKIAVKKNSGAPVSFMITPNKLGSIEIKVGAFVSGLGEDVVRKNLLVQAEGETQYFTKSILIDLRNKNLFKGNITLELPKNIVSESEKIEIAVLGDLLWTSITNLNNLIYLPTGCGEQNLIHFVPNLITLNYLIKTRQLTPTILEEAISNMEKAYQQQLTYKRTDGSFSAFGNRDSNSSIWITAYVALAFKQAKPFIFVDDNIISTALKWLDEQQASNGSFIETGTIIHSNMQSKDKNLALTAFTLLAFIENQKSFPIYSNTITRALDFVAQNLDDSASVYTIAICSYVLQLANHPSKLGTFNILDVKAKTGDNLKWWAEPILKNEEKNPWNHLPKSLDIEATSYALLSFLEQNLLEDAQPVLNWLIQQQNNFGGFTSTQDTVIGMIALYKLVSKLSINTNMQIDFKYKDGEDQFRINPNNGMIEQKLQINKETRIVNITAQGEGIAIFRVVYKYNTNVTGPWPMFTLDPQVDKNSNQYHLQLSICTAFVSKNLTSSPESNMAIMEVSLPSGFTADIDSLPSLEVSQNVQKVDTKNDYTTIVLYFNNLTRYEYCPTVSAFQTHKVAKQKPVSVIVYDYYDSSRRARIFYKTKYTSLCDICDDDDCINQCKEINSEQFTGPVEGHANLKTVNNWMYIILMTFIILY